MKLSISYYWDSCKEYPRVIIENLEVTQILGSDRYILKIKKEELDSFRSLAKEWDIDILDLHLSAEDKKIEVKIKLSGGWVAKITF